MASSWAPTGPSSSRPPQPRELTKEIKAQLGCVANKTRCIRCWEKQSAQHLRNWRSCNNLCPRCPWNDQHWGQACPLLLAPGESNPEWWRCHAGTAKPPLRPAPVPFSQAPTATTTLLQSSLYSATSKTWTPVVTPPSANPDAAQSQKPPAQTFILKIEPGLEGLPQVKLEPMPQEEARRTADHRSRDRSRSRSPVRAANADKPARPYRDRDPLPRQELPPRPPGTKPASPAKPLSPPTSSTSDTSVGAKNETTSSSKEGTTGTSPNEPLRPTAILWSDGSRTANSIRALLCHDPFMAMVFHQMVLFADFFQRHPEAVGGQQLISDGMSRYLSDIRAQDPDYLSLRPAGARLETDNGSEEGEIMEDGAEVAGDGAKSMRRK